MHIRDLGSTNGTFLHGKRLGSVPVPVQHDDVIHVVSEEIRILRVERPLQSFKTLPQRVVTASLPFDWTSRSARLVKILDGNLEAWFQPIVDFDSNAVAWEALGRGRVGDSVVTPDEMFLTARENEMELELCRALRTAALHAAVGLPEPRRLFLNAAPDDLMDSDQLLDELRAFRERNVSVVVEIHEAAVVDPDFMLRFHADLIENGCRLAFDDFGAGHSRLLELTQLRPDYLKFDTSFIQGIDQAPAIRQDIVRLFVSLVRDYGIASIAEGVEREEEAAFCRAAGFELAQGHYFGRPVPLGDL
jgi:EAL domain-containing protein (putative c-di-GMP-specific phosphodiesterase class I)